MDSMSLKIHSFLKSVGVPTTETNNASNLVAYFEKEYGLKMMSFLEYEWLNEQLDRDTASGAFAEMRPFVHAKQLEDFDGDVAYFSKKDGFRH